MRFQLTDLLFLSMAVAPTLARIAHDIRTGSLDGREQVSLYENSPANEYLADSAVFVLAITTKDLRDEAKATQNAAIHGMFFGGVNTANNKWSLYHANYDKQLHPLSHADRILELQLITAAMTKAGVGSSTAFEPFQWNTIRVRANAFENMAYIDASLNIRKTAVITHLMNAISAGQDCKFKPDADQGVTTRNLNHELISYMHSMCQKMLNTAMDIDIAAFASKNGNFNHALRLHERVASLLKCMDIPVTALGENVYKCTPTAILSYVPHTLR